MLIWRSVRLAKWPAGRPSARTDAEDTLRQGRDGVPVGAHRGLELGRLPGPKIRREGGIRRRPCIIGIVGQIERPDREDLLVVGWALPAGEPRQGFLAVADVATVLV